MLVDYSLLIHAQRLRVNRSPAWPGVEESAQGWPSRRDCDGKTTRRGPAVNVIKGLKAVLVKMSRLHNDRITYTLRHNAWRAVIINYSARRDADAT